MRRIWHFKAPHCLGNYALCWNLLYLFGNNSSHEIKAELLHSIRLDITWFVIQLVISSVCGCCTALSMVWHALIHWFLFPAVRLRFIVSSLHDLIMTLLRNIKLHNNNNNNNTNNFLSHDDEGFDDRFRFQFSMFGMKYWWIISTPLCSNWWGGYYRMHYNWHDLGNNPACRNVEKR